MSESRDGGLADVYVECLLPGPVATSIDVPVPGPSMCLALHRVELLRTMSSVNSERLLCHFRAPDVESVRMALRRADYGIGAIWVDGG